MTFFLETRQLIIRKRLETDIEFLATIITNKKVQEHLGGVFGNYERTLADIKKNPPTIDKFYIIVLKDTNKAIGFVTFLFNDYLVQKEIAIYLMPEHWGNSYGSESLSVIKDLWINLYGMESMIATVVPGNLSSVSMLKKEGFMLVDKYLDSSRAWQHVYKYIHKE